MNHILELRTVSRNKSVKNIRNRKSITNFFPHFQNQNHQIQKYPQSTQNRIVLLPNFNNVGFRYKFNADNPIHQTDLLMLGKLPIKMREEIDESLKKINQKCYQKWNQESLQKQANPIDSFQSCLKLFFLFSILCIVFFIFGDTYSFISEQMVIYITVSCIASILLLEFLLVLFLAFKTNQDQNIKQKIDIIIKSQLKIINQSTKYNLRWIKPHRKEWIYVLIPDSQSFL